MSIFDIVVGDVVALKIGDQVRKQTEHFALISTMFVFLTLYWNPNELLGPS